VADAEPAVAALRGRLVDLFGRLRDTRLWVGARPEGGVKRAPHALAETIGYPRPTLRDGSDAPFLEIDLRLAAITLAKLATQSQAYGFSSAPPADLVDELEQHLGLLGDGARFFSNADHATPWVTHDPPHRSGPAGHEMVIGATRVVSISPCLSEATFDTGVVGVGADIAFVVWGEDED
jgi:hypothetical protein